MISTSFAAAAFTGKSLTARLRPFQKFCPEIRTGLRSLDLDTAGAFNLIFSGGPRNPAKNKK